MKKKYVYRVKVTLYDHEIESKEIFKLFNDLESAKKFLNNYISENRKKLIYYELSRYRVKKYGALIFDETYL